MRSPILAVLLALCAFPAVAQTPCRGPDGIGAPGPETTVPPNHFQRVPGRGLACALTREAGAAMADETRAVSYLPCLKVGAVAVGDEVGAIERLLGPSTHVRNLDWRTEAKVYPIRQRSIPEPYYVVTYQNRVAVAVQLIGPPTEMPATFSSLSLGDSTQKVLDALGKPSRRCLLQGDGPETWMWQPFPIGIDIIDGVVVGMKATWPAGRETPE